MSRPTSRAPARTTLTRMRAVFGIPSTLVLAGFFLSQSVVNLITDLISTWQANLVWFGACTVVALLAFDRWNRQVTSTLTASTLGRSGDAKLGARRGLVVVMGLGSDQVGSPVAKLLAASPNMDYLALVGTPETQRLGVARRIRTTLMPSLGRVLPATHVRLLEQGNNAQSVADFEQATSDAIGWMLRQGLSPDEIVVDTSDGRRAMGFGALLAAEAAGVELQYLASAWDPMTNAPLPGVEMFKVARERCIAPADVTL